MNEETENEMAMLHRYENITNDAVIEYAAKYELLDFEKEKILKLLFRMFDSEKDYLIQCPAPDYCNTD